MDKQPQITRYHKKEEHRCSSYEMAATVADRLFAPHGEKTASDERTTEAVKVRIRRNKQEGGYRVVLLQVPQEQSEPTEATTVPRKRQRRARNDRKGRKRAETA